MNITHAATDYTDADQSELHDECVHVQFNRDEHPIDAEMPGVFRVEIHPDDRPLTFEKSVARELAKRGFDTILDGHGGNGILVAKKFFRRTGAYIQIKAL